uniref:Golgi SNAP receptor complex member 1 n=1 Tax=Cryptomonas curvata TaxID=233186 RepID=A0A7S0QR18_9CRYP|mmetsp:Transcript_46466/g.97247  ORF Transcript_46466/g.97247 Transcript_46466/m.97247 type:complete len:234 (+) Transcript_46466:184-885(+)|eukprot:CAMPEP_0172166348 /NCGR_PEP_ID=MMETSP1050-20130122/8930_1 /TAXON_ID=233186 /ORGANISM="Cryptomonas curvata, Strain CCAP979/52" /LENGTH=233 /DNA_ID=CAMNT_0012836945 /DNA_START=179 /DNA_END=880 /DNA_ORIENTATION=+
MAAVSGLQQWEELRRRALRLETEVDSKLIAYNKVITEASISISTSEFSGAQESGKQSSLPEELESCLQQLSEANESMGRCVRELPPGDSTRMMHVLQRHRDVLHDYDKEFRKIRATIKELREREELLSSVRQDIGEYRNARTDPLLRERMAAANSLRTADQTLGNAAATFDSLRSQRTTYSGIATKLAGLRSRLPTIDSLMNRIQKRKKVESVILGLVAGVCGIVIVYFAVLR